MQNINDLLKNMDPIAKAATMEKANAFIKTKEGAEVLSKLNGIDSKDINAIMAMISKNPELIKAIEKFFK